MYRQPRIIFNDDSDILARYVPRPHGPDKVYTAVDYLKKTPVDMLCWCVAAQMAYSYPSRVVENSFEILTRLARRDPGVYRRQDKNLMLSLYRQGIDYLPLLIQRAHHHRKAFIASFRMNDTHHKSTPDGPGTTAFWKDRQSYRLWGVADAKSYYNAALDYSYPEVRQHYADMIKEVVERYDIDGIELDFSRTSYLFQPDEAWHKRRILTRFIREIRNMVRRVAARKGRRMLILIRTLFSKAELDRFGMDLETWIQAKLMDILVLTNLTNNYNCAVSPWLEQCHKKGIRLYPAVEATPALFDKDRHSVLPNNPLAPAHNYGPPRNNIELLLKQFRGMTQNYLAQGVDGIYLFNYRCIYQEKSKCRADTPEKFNRLTSLLFQMGSAPVLRPTAKQYLFWSDLPLYAESGRPPQYHQTIRFFLRDPALRARRTKVTIRFRQIAMRNPHASGEYRQNPFVPRGWMTYLLNGKAVAANHIRVRRQPEGRIESGFVLGKHALVMLEVSVGSLKVGENQLAFHVPRSPHDRDPYIYIYQLEVDITPRR